MLPKLTVEGGRAASNIAKLQAEISRYRIALQGVSGGQAEFLQLLEGTRRISDRFNTPLADATQQVTQLAAAMKSAGFSGAQVLSVYESLSAANTALGGDADRLRGILLATNQVFSKGKVAAEELRGQIGERLAGAFSDFAVATGRSTRGLDKALEKGEVSLQDFLAFVEFVGKKYEKTADKVAQSSESAGARLSKAWENASLALGPVLQQMGSAIQNWATWVLRSLQPVFDGIAYIAGASRKAQNDRLYTVNQTLARNEQLIPQLEARTGETGVAERLAVLKRQSEELRKEKATLSAILYPKSTGTPTKPKQDDPALDPKKLEEAVKLRSELRQLAIQQAQIEMAAGTIGQDRLSQLRAEGDAMKKLLRMQLDDIAAEGGPLQKAKTGLAIAQYKKDTAELAQEIKDLLTDVKELEYTAAGMRKELLGGQLATVESPLEGEVRKVKEELRDADREAEKLLLKLNQLAGTNPESAAARTTIGNLRGDIAAVDPNKLASQRLTAGDAASLAQEIRQMTADTSTLGQLMAKYGDDWKKLHPDTQQHLTDLAQQKDALIAADFQFQQLATAVNGLGTAITGLFEAAITGTNDWNASLQNTLRSLSNLLLQAGFKALGGGDGRGFFSILSGDFRGGGGGAGAGAGAGALANFNASALQYRASGGPVTGGRPYIVGEQGPELFVPGRGGSVIPNHQLGGGDVVYNQTVNISSDGKVTSDDASRLGRLMETAAMGVIQRERRPGGLLSR